MSSFIHLIFASLFEILWVFYLDKSEGFTDLRFTLLAVLSTALSLLFLAKASVHLPLTICYSFWVSSGLIGSALIQHFYINKPLPIFAWVYILGLMLCSIGLQHSLKQ